VVPRDRLDQARVVGATPRVAPGRRSVLGQPAIIETRQPPMYVMTRQVVVHRQPPPPPVPFTAREPGPARPTRPPARRTRTIATLRARTPSANPRPLVRPAAPAPARPERPAPALRPAREGLPPQRTVPPSVAEPRPERRRASAPAPPPAATPAPAQPERPDRLRQQGRPVPNQPRSSEKRPRAVPLPQSEPSRNASSRSDGQPPSGDLPRSARPSGTRRRRKPVVD